jgi:mono/diheme cytochrome c family protein
MVVLSLGAYIVLLGAKPVEIPFDNATRVALGELIYQEECSACHGADLQGEAGWETRDADGYFPAPPLDETGHAWHHPDALLFDIVKAGPEAVVGAGYQSRMPGLEGRLSDEDILSVLAYVKSTWPLVISEAHNWVNGKPSGSPVRPEDLAACGLSLGLEEAKGLDG